MTADLTAWIDNPGHRAWLSAETGRLLDFYLAAADFGAGGFWALDNTGAPDRPKPKELWINARLVHCFALGSLLGHPGCTALVAHGLDGLHRVFHDARHGGWFWTTADFRKQTYGHAFVLLAACSAAQAGFDTVGLIAEVTGLLGTRFFEPQQHLYIEGRDREFTSSEDYRGQSPNMHLVEAFMAAAEATGDQGYLDRALPIATRIIGEFAAADGWDPGHTGFVYTVDGDGAPVVADRFHWVATEAIGAAAYLFRATEDPSYDRWYLTFWDHAALFLIDRRHGSWHHELTPANHPAHTTWPNKPDLYHALQATLFPQTPCHQAWPPLWLSGPRAPAQGPRPAPTLDTPRPCLGPIRSAAGPGAGRSRGRSRPPAVPARGVRPRGHAGG